jgi:hypothetical protein
MMLRMSAIAIVVLLASMIPAKSRAEGTSPSCKPVKHYDVTGCELLPGQTCPPGYQKQAVGPPNPRMAGPTHLMCVADKPQPKEQPPKSPPKSNH